MSAPRVFPRPLNSLGVVGGVRGMTSLAPPVADEARRGRRSGRISRAWARQRREDFFGYRKRGFNQAPRNFARRLAPHQFTKLMEGKRGFGGFEGWDPQGIKAAEHVRSEPPRPVILSAAKDLLRLLSHIKPRRRANRVPGLPPTGPERDDPAEPDHKVEKAV